MVTSAVGPMVRTAAVILAIELVVIAVVRRSYSARPREERGTGLRAGGAAAGPR